MEPILNQTAAWRISLPGALNSRTGPLGIGKPGCALGSGYGNILMVQARRQLRPQTQR